MLATEEAEYDLVKIGDEIWIDNDRDDLQAALDDVDFEDLTLRSVDVGNGDLEDFSESHQTNTYLLLINSAMPRPDHLPSVRVVVLREGELRAGVMGMYQSKVLSAQQVIVFN